ncbi:MAG: twitching motility protein PilT [Lachnospiraceae bacterium]|nr:twitching motility protein PilT [Lachnospiraceae bacterium]
MIQIISGEKGKGKTKFLLERVNEAVKKANGNIVFLDKNTKHMYELSNKVRLINVPELPVDSPDEFTGFLCGILSQDNDLEEVYLDSFLTIAHIQNMDEFAKILKKLNVLSDKYNIKFTLSVSKDEKDLPECAKQYIDISL